MLIQNILHCNKYHRVTLSPVRYLTIYDLSKLISVIWAHFFALWIIGQDPAALFHAGSFMMSPCGQRCKVHEAQERLSGQHFHRPTAALRSPQHSNVLESVSTLTHMVKEQRFVITTTLTWLLEAHMRVITGVHFLNSSIILVAGWYIYCYVLSILQYNNYYMNYCNNDFIEWVIKITTSKWVCSAMQKLKPARIHGCRPRLTNTRLSMWANHPGSLSSFLKDGDAYGAVQSITHS